MAFSVCCVTGFHMVAGELGRTSVQRYSHHVHAYPSHVLSVLGLSVRLNKFYALSNYQTLPVDDLTKDLRLKYLVTFARLNLYECMHYSMSKMPSVHFALLECRNTPSISQTESGF